MIRSADEIWREVSAIDCGWRKRRNFAEKIKSESNAICEFVISLVNDEIRRKKANGYNEQHVSALYDFKSVMQMRIIE